MGYLSFQGAGASSGRGQAAPWCVSTWGVDGGLGDRYPLSVRDLSLAFAPTSPATCEQLVRKHKQ